MGFHRPTGPRTAKWRLSTEPLWNKCGALETVNKNLVTGEGLLRVMDGIRDLSSLVVLLNRVNALFLPTSTGERTGG